MKKAIIAGTSIATMALMAMPALAFWPPCQCSTPDPCPCPVNISVTNVNESTVRTANVAVTNTGLNGTSQFGKINIARIETGDASAIAGVTNQVGFNEVRIGEIENGTIGVTNLNHAYVGTVNAAISNTGANHIGQGGCVNVATIKTGNAGTSASVVNLVGQSLVDIDD